MAQPPNPRATRVRQRIAVYNQTHASRPIDDRAALAVAGTEGLSGRIGDGGHAFGDFQLNDAGGVLTHKFDGWTPQQKQAWASSPAGIDYALGGIGNAAGGLKGADAVRRIVTQFERPADPGGEIARALAGLGGAGAGASPAPAAAASLAAPQAQASPPDTRRMFAQSLLASMNQNGSLDQAGLLGALQQRRTALQTAPVTEAAAPVPMAPLMPQPGTAGGRDVLAELLHEGVGGPTHSTGEHIHVALTDPRAMLAAIQHAQQMGLSARENPYTDPVDPVHAKNSFHNRNFPGKYNGRTLGEATDVSGDRQKMGAYEQWVRATFGGRR